MTIYRYPYKVPVNSADGDNITDSPTEAVDYICLKRCRLKYGSGANQYYGNNIPDQSKVQKEYKPNIAYIAMPPQLSTAYQAGYSKVDVGITGIAALEGLQNNDTTELTKTIQGAANAALPEFTSAGVASILNAFGGLLGLKGQMDANTIQALSKGRVFNPFSEQIFQSMGFRTHTFNIKMVSRNPDEARQVYNIIKFMKTGMAPKVGSAAETGGEWDPLSNVKQGWDKTANDNKGDNVKKEDEYKKLEDAVNGKFFGDTNSWGYNKRFFQIPDHFEMRFVRATESDDNWYNPATGASGNTATMHFRMHPSFCTGVSVNYTPDNQYTSFKRFDGSMVQVPAIQLGLQFVETRLISQADMENGY